MSDDRWSHQESIETTVPAAAIWRLFADVAGWKRWNDGIEAIDIHGSFAQGTTFSMKPPGEDAFTSTLLEVCENEGFTDETLLGDIRVLVHHRIVPLANGYTRIVYGTEVAGPGAAEVGRAITADFPDVLAALKRLAENPT